MSLKRPSWALPSLSSNKLILRTDGEILQGMNSQPEQIYSELIDFPAYLLQPICGGITLTRTVIGKLSGDRI